MAVEKRFSINLDIKRSTSNRDFEVVEGDTGNYLDIVLTDNGEPVDVSECLVAAIFTRGDGMIMQQDNETETGVTVRENNHIEIHLFNTSFSPGLNECELQIFSGEDRGTLVTSAKFNFKCRRGSANEETVQSTEEWPLLTGMVRRVEVLEGELEQLIPTAEQATQDANTAAERAEDAAVNADEKADDATTAAAAATNAASRANAAADSADAAAGEAETAADRANAAAEAAEDVVGGALPNHAFTHATGGADELTPDMIGAANKTVSTAITLLADGWTGEGPYEQTISIAHLTGDRFENPDVFPEFTDELEAEREAWNLVDQVVSVEGGLLFTCLTETPDRDITLIVKVRD